MTPPAYPQLLSPLDLGRIRLRNRVQVTAHTTFNIDRDHLPNEDDVAYFAARAAGGAALVTMGTTVVHPSSPRPYGVYANFDDRILGPYQQLTTSVHEHGALVIPQLGHMSQRADGLSGPVVGPSGVSFHSGGRIPHELTHREITEIVAAFADAADRAVRGGMDGVELAVGHGQLINTFLSPLTNTRNDAYGGSTERRRRFLAEILDAVRQRIGDRPLLAARVNGSDEVEGSLTQDDWLEINEWIASTGTVDYLNVSANFHGSVIPTMAVAHGCYVPYARAVKQRVAIPVFCVGRITEPELAEHILASGDADVVGMTRAHIADPDLVTKLVSGRRAEIRPCIGCVQMCVGEVFRGHNVKCVYNAATGFERTRRGMDTVAAALHRRVVVIGGGPAGLEAARVAAGRGHDVVLLERSHCLGGTMRLAARPPTRAELARAVDWLSAEVARLGVDVHLSCDADADMVMAMNPDVVIVATGAEAACPPWALGRQRVVSARQLLADERPAEDVSSALVIDDDHRSQGLVVAAYLADSGVDVCLISERPGIAELLEVESRTDLLAFLGRGGRTRFEILTRCIAVEESADRAEAHLLNTASLVERTATFDLVVTTWARPADALLVELEGRVPIHGVGDVLSPHRLEAAVHSAFAVAAAI